MDESVPENAHALFLKIKSHCVVCPYHSCFLGHRRDLLESWACPCGAKLVGMNSSEREKELSSGHLATGKGETEPSVSSMPRKEASHPPSGALGTTPSQCQP